MIGLDIGTAAVKAAQVQRKGRRYTVTGLARAPVKASAGATDTSLATVTAIQQCLTLLGRKEDVVCGLSGPGVAVRTFDLPALTRKQLASAVELEAAQVCPFDVHEGAVAFQVLGNPSSKIRLHAADKAARTTGILAAAKKDSIRRLQDLCRRAQVQCIMLDVDGLALLNCLEACGGPQSGSTALILNVGSTYTNLALLTAQGQPFLLDVEYSGAEIVQHLDERIPAGREAVLAVLDEVAKSELTPQARRSDLKKACRPLAERVLEMLRYHGTRQTGPGVDKILLCGGLAGVPVVEALRELLDRPVELWDPLAALACTPRVRDESGPAAQGPQFAVALGLAMRSVRDVQN